MVEEDAVHRSAHRLVTAEREAEVREAPADVRTRAAAADFLGRCDEVDRVTTVLVDARGDSENVGVEDNVAGIRTVCHEQFVRAFADADLALGCVRLPDLVEGHYDDG